VSETDVCALHNTLKPCGF